MSTFTREQELMLCTHCLPSFEASAFPVPILSHVHADGEGSVVNSSLIIFLDAAGIAFFSQL